MSRARLCSGVTSGTGAVDGGNATAIDSEAVTESSSDQTSATDARFFTLVVFSNVCLVLFF
ncbi:hypothetical protein LEP1GSC036_3904 [Leptospira weilii str. 2006001853]|uniref:Uncharacterized protein n=1 Tax=Leptospira weilii str. 2006001853 TaxID=1001589 RepID=A0A828Z5R1_9LEPT|nr:hypothetical protein LEP1GSC036_3904 [Leptospira weilii str. 2006001853]EMJ66184.1 hypothetical protein LEP1GSC051_1261 [Leptospira sp. P2653]